jgi:hypothetical protein
MPSDKYVRVIVDGQPLDLESPDRLPVSISYRKEDPDDFQRKRSSETFSIQVPATVNNDQVGNTFHNPGIEDLTEGEVFRKPRPAVIEANGYELLVGKAFLKQASHTDVPDSYEYDFYGNNGDWLIDLKEASLYDFLKHISFTFSKINIENSWAFDGEDEEMPFVFAPVRYGQPFDEGFENLIMANPPKILDYNCKPEYMRPALSKYWLLYWGFKSLGYKIKSDFFNTSYFRRQVMPWTWGNFLFSEGTRLNNLDFLAKSTEALYYYGVDLAGQIADLKVSNDSTNGAFDNNGVYNYNTTTRRMEWTYLPAYNYGTLIASFRLQVQIDAAVTQNSAAELRVQWFKNGVRVTTGNPGENTNGDVITNLNAPTIGRRDDVGLKDINQSFTVNPGDVISARFYIYMNDSGTGYARLRAEVIGYELDYFTIPLGGVIDFENYTGFKKYKFLDFLAGVVDEFNLSIETDPINKVVLIEPTHAYSLDNTANASGGYYNGSLLDWNDKQDVSKRSVVRLYSDIERELLFRYKDDSNDGVLKVVQDRYQTRLSQGKYVLPERYKSGKKDVENRFFSPVVHYEHEQWKGLGSDAVGVPQIIALVPENRSNTSRGEAQNTFNPKSAYYKGLISNVGWVFDNEKKTNYPYMFAVNYQAGGEDDPCLSYSDEKVGSVIVKGLLKRFYLQRMAILRNGQYYTTHFKLNSNDVGNWYQRELKIVREQKWELLEISNFSAVKEQSTQCLLRKWVPVTQSDADNTFPSADALEGDPGVSSFDTKYSPLKCLRTDISTE